MNAAQYTDFGYQCPVRGCDKKKNRRFSAQGLCSHIVQVHGETELINRLRAKYKSR